MAAGAASIVCRDAASFVERALAGLVSALETGSFESTSGISSIASRMLVSDASISTSLSPDLILILT